MVTPDSSLDPLNSFGSLSPTQIQTFQNQGYLVVRQVVSPSDLVPMVGIISRVVDQQADRFYAAGKITDLCQQAPFEDRWYRILQQFGGQNEVYGWHTTVFSQALFDLITHPAVLDVVGSLTEGETQFNGDFWARPKLPEEKLTTLPWHQDSAYMPDTEHHTHLTVWMPLVDVCPENGTLQFVPGSHKLGLKPHLRIEGESFKSPVDDPAAGNVDIDSLEMEVGDLVIFHNLVFHRSLINHTESIRWSVDFRYSQANTPLGELWHRPISCIVRSHRFPHMVAGWDDWRALWNASPHKSNFLW